MCKVVVWLSWWLDTVDSLVKIITFGRVATVYGVKLRVWLFLTMTDEVTQHGQDNGSTGFSSGSPKHAAEDNYSVIARAGLDNRDD